MNKKESYIVQELLKEIDHTRNSRAYILCRWLTKIIRPIYLLVKKLTTQNKGLSTNANIHSDKKIDNTILNNVEYDYIIVTYCEDNNYQKRIKKLNSLTGNPLIIIICDIAKKITYIDSFIITRDIETIISFIKYKYCIVYATNSTEAYLHHTLKRSFLWIDCHDKYDIKDIENVSFISGHKNNSDHNSAIRVINYDIQKALNAKLEFMLLYANIKENIYVSCKTKLFFDFNGKKFMGGGAERYLVDLETLLKKHNIKFIIFQLGDYEFVRIYNNILCISLGEEEYIYKKSQDYKFTQAYNMFIKNNSLLTICSDFTQALPMIVNKTIGISHGIFWDNTSNEYTNLEKSINNARMVIDSVRKLDKLVSVDSNTINYIQCFDYKLAKQASIIVNYVDTNMFVNKSKNNDYINILYPRRLYEARGLGIMLEIVDDILNENKKARFIFAGLGERHDLKRLNKKEKQWGERCIVCHYSFDRMHELYSKCDICVIPTLYSEGTSLSCIEAMAAGCAVVATRVGGLNDIIIDGYNGLLADPCENDVRNKIVMLINNTDKRLELQNNAMHISSVFDKELWKEKWWNILKEYINEAEMQYEDYKICNIILDDKKKIEQYTNIIKKLLLKNYFIFIISNKYKNIQSCTRLQFIGKDNGIYHNANIIIDEQKKENNSLTIEESIKIINRL